MRRTSHRGSNYPIMAAGWLFADLLLVLFLVGWGTDATVAVSAPTPSVSITPRPTPSLSPSPSPSASPSPTPPPPPGLAKEPVTISLSVGLSGGSLTDPESVTQTIAAEIHSLKRPGSQAGMVLVWGHARDVNQGMRIADAVAQLLEPAASDTFAASTLRSFWKGGQAGRVDLEIYFLTTG